MKKLIAIATLALSLSAMASIFNCKTTSGQTHKFNFTIDLQGDAASLRNNTTGKLENCSAVIDGEMQLIQCDWIVIGIAKEQIDLDGGNTVYQTADGSNGFMKCLEK